MVVENAFGQLKGQWRCPLRLNVQVDNASTIVRACAILHMCVICVKCLVIIVWKLGNMLKM